MILDVFNKNFSRIENISSYSYADYVQPLNAAGDFEVRVPLDSVALTIMKDGVFLLFEKEIAGFITYLQPTYSEEDGNAELSIKGHLLNGLLSRRCIPLTTNLSGTTTAIVRSLVNTNCVNPTDSKRALPIALSTNSQYIPASDTTRIQTQITGGDVETEIETLLEAREMGYSIVPILTSSAIDHFEFRVIAGEDRTIGNQSGNDAVVFSFDLKNILQSVYTYNSNDLKNMAYVAGEGEGAARTLVESGETSKTGLDRYELYVDARDLQSDDGEGTVLTPTEYNNVLDARGLEKLKENILEESYEASINQLTTQYIYGVDYFLGDLVTIRDPNLDISLNARVTQVKASSIGERTMVDVTFGYYKLNTAKKLRRKGVI